MGSIISNILKVRFVTIFCIFILLCMLSINTGQCRPEKRHHNRHNHKRPHSTTTPAPEEDTIDPESEKQVQPCFEDPATMDLCQRCAKESKSNIVFPLCCSNIDKVKDWCEDYIYFGL